MTTFARKELDSRVSDQMTKTTDSRLLAIKPLDVFLLWCSTVDSDLTYDNIRMFDNVDYIMLGRMISSFYGDFLLVGNSK